MIDPQIALKLQPFLSSGERLLWADRPARGLRFDSRDLFLIPFSILWLGFVVFWESQVVRMQGSSFMVIWGAGFFGIGLFFFIGRFFVDAWVRARTVYAVTNQRALSLRRLRGERLLTADLRGVIVDRHPDGRGNLRFGPREGFPLRVRVGFSSWSPRNSAAQGNSLGMSYWVPSLSDRVEFLSVNDVMTPYRLASEVTSAP